MLLRFSVENFACFAEEATLSLVASADDSHPNHTVSLRDGNYPKGLKVSAVYGANGHGKSKLVEALGFLRDLVVHGRQPDEGMGRAPFRLDKTSLSKPSRFEVVVYHLGVEYTYGLVIDDRAVREEWLFARPRRNEMRYFERTTNDDGEVQVEPGPSLLGSRPKGRSAVPKTSTKPAEERQYLGFVARGTRANQPFLTEAVDRKVDRLLPLYRWFREALVIIAPEMVVQPIELMAKEVESFTRFMGEFLAVAGTGIESVSVSSEPLDIDKHLPKLPSDLRRKIENDLGEMLALTFKNAEGGSFALIKGTDGVPTLLRMKLVHQGQPADTAPFDLEEESAGTQRLMEILPILGELGSGEPHVYVIDELDRKLHPLLSRLFVQTFLARSAQAGSQLLFTTHETSLLDLDLLRRDEIWFVEKDRQGHSHLCSLAEFRVRSDLRIEKGYLQGRFGAIPFAGDAAALGWNAEG